MRALALATMTRSANSRASGGPPASGIQARAISFTPGTYDAASRSVEAVLATTAPVRRVSYVEVLAITPEAVDLSRVVAGLCPLLDSHDATSIDSILGRLESARIENEQVIVRIRFAESERGRAAEQAVVAGDVTGLSAGYDVQKWVLVSTEDGVDTWRAESWILLEGTLCAVPADAATGFRSEPAISAAPTPLVTGKRATDLVAQARSFGLEKEAGALIRAGLTEPAIRAEIARAAAARQEPNRLIGGGLGGYQAMHNDTLDNPAFMRSAIEGALYARMSGNAPEGAAAEFMGRTILDMGAMLAEARGERVSRRSKDALVDFVMQRQHTTSDFPTLLTGAGNRVLMQAYSGAQTPLKMMSRNRRATNFRPLTRVRLGEAPALKKVSEGGEVEYGTRAEAKEAFSISTFARIFSLSRQAIINDDLSAFADVNIAWGRASADREAAELVALLAANSGNGATLDDGNPLYTTTRGNKAASGAAPSVTTLSAARKAMRETKGLDGVSLISVTPKFLLVGASTETAGEQVLTDLLANQVAEVNPFAKRLQLAVEPRLTGNAWRLFADPAEASALEYAYLDGAEGPIMRTREGWNVLGIEFQCILDFGCGVADWRGTFLNPGA